MSQSVVYNTISFNIKKSEEFLKDFPITNYVYLFINPEMSLEWRPLIKRILLHNGSITKPLIEHPIKVRIEAYKHLPKLIQKCIESETNFDLESVSMANSELELIFDSNKAQ